MNLVDIHLEGHPFTWWRGKGSGRYVEERLDRAMVNPEWLSLFPEARLDNLLAPISDHIPIVLNCDEVLRPPIRERFKFENYWLLEPGVDEVVRKGWSKAEMGDVMMKLAGCVDELDSWSRGLKLKYKEEIQNCKVIMERYRGDVNSSEAVIYNEASDRMIYLLIQEECFWCQRAKTHWLREGDLNTSYFHA